MQPDFSVVIAAYNAEATLGRAIESALAQRGVTVEVLVADDRSTDATAAVARSYGAQVRLIALEENRGPGGARNAALEQATGRWLAVLDSDDTMQEDRLVRLLARAGREHAQVAVDNLEIVRETAPERDIMFPYEFLASVSTIDLAAFIRSNVIFRSTFNFGYMKPVFERAFVETHRLRYDESLRIGEDYIFLASALALGARCAVEPATGYSYHIRSGSISRVLELRHVRAMLAADEQFAARYPLDHQARSAYEERRRSLVEAAAFLSMVQHLKDGAPLKALGAAFRQPAAVRHFRMPIEVRLKRLARPLASALPG